MSFKKMDPSCTIGFYCESKAEFEKFRQQTTEVSAVIKRHYPKHNTAFFVKKYSSTPICLKFSRAFGTHLDPFTSGDVCCDQGPNLLNNFVASSKQGCKTSSQIKGSGWVLKSLLNFHQIIGVEEYFFLIIMLSQQMNLHSVTAFFHFHQVLNFPLPHHNACVLTCEHWTILVLSCEQTLPLVSWPLTMTQSFTTTE